MKKGFMFFALLSIIVFSCKDKEEDFVQPSNVVAPSGLTYSPASMSVMQGQEGTSAMPSINGTSPMNYTVTTSPASAGMITIKSTGVIKSSTTLSAGTYNVTVTATNSAGSAVFSNAYSITVTP